MFLDKLKVVLSELSDDTEHSDRLKMKKKVGIFID